MFLIRGFEYAGGLRTISFLALIAVSAVVQLIAAWCIIRSYYGYWYERIPATRVLLKYKSDLIKYYEQTGRTAKEAEKNFESYYVERLAEAADTNRDNNLKAGDALHNATRSLIGALIVLALSAVPFVYETRGSFGSTTSVTLADPVHVVLLENSAIPNEQDQTQNNSQGGQTEQSPYTS